jgi:hypothetical protein
METGLRKQGARCSGDLLSDRFHYEPGECPFQRGALDFGMHDLHECGRTGQNSHVILMSGGDPLADQSVPPNSSGETLTVQY